MIKLKWLILNLAIIPIKIFGLFWFWVVAPFRSYARHIVYLYALQRGKFIPKRLLERHPAYSSYEYCWILKSKSHLEAKGGYIRNDRLISNIEYYFALWVLWIWLDDDAYCDTFSASHNETYLIGERKFLGIIPLNNKLGRILLQGKECEKSIVKGNAFDIGDYRATQPKFNFLGTLIWTWRNSSYNYSYMFMQKALKKEDVFLYKIGNFKFGYEYDSSINGIDYYTNIFFKNF